VGMVRGDGDLGSNGRIGGGLSGVDRNDEGEGGGGGVQERGESWIPSPESFSLRSSISQHRLAAFLVRLAGGSEAVGDLTGESGGGDDCDGSSSGTCSGSGGHAMSAGGVGGAGDGAESTDWSSLVAAAAMAAGGGASEASVAAAFWRHRRR
jgi:hypothetical protein